MSPKSKRFNGDESGLSDIRMAILYGIDGLKNCRETKENDDWLSLFSTALDTLQSPHRHAQGNFPLEDVSNSVDEEVFEKLEHLSTEAERIRSKELEGRNQISENEIVSLVEEAEEVYERLERTDN